MKLQSIMNRPADKERTDLLDIIRLTLDRDAGPSALAQLREAAPQLAADARLHARRWFTDLSDHSLRRVHRAFVTRAVTWAVGQGISQFLDLGAGLPASPAVHQAARAVLPAARVAYVDNDPVVLAHARALLATDDGVTAVVADLRDPAAVLSGKELQAVIDPAQPTGVIRRRRR
ncbi:MAG: SAM-dependent methyltransferase [Streptosporangiaceae bacterium]